MPSSSLYMIGRRPFEVPRLDVARADDIEVETVLPDAVAGLLVLCDDDASEATDATEGCLTCPPRLAGCFGVDEAEDGGASSCGVLRIDCKVGEPRGTLDELPERDR